LKDGAEIAVKSAFILFKQKLKIKINPRWRLAGEDFFVRGQMGLRTSLLLKKGWIL
jgi:hypothetical protein